MPRFDRDAVPRTLVFGGVPQAAPLVDEMTYSAAEEFLLDLQGLDHVTVLECATGGGSGRPRTVPLLDDLVLTVSTALIYDRMGRCIEHHGVPVDGGLTG